MYQVYRQCIREVDCDFRDLNYCDSLFLKENVDKISSYNLWQNYNFTPYFVWM
jgi:hypothetical protein